jgi:hypothetical protein
VFSLNLLRAEPDFMGYQSVVYTSSGGRGSVERTSETMIPWVDRITVGLYSHLSLTTLRTSEPMAVWHPSLDTYAGALRMTYDGKSRITLRPDSFKVIGWYVVGDLAHAQKFDNLLVDELSPTAQKVSDLSGKPFGSGAQAPESDDEADHTQGCLTGFIVKFNSKARERTGQVVVGNGQVRLVAQSTELDDNTIALHPIAVVTNVEDPTKKAFAHFRINVDNTYTASVGGSSDAIMAFEFPMPARYRPLALYVKGVRVDIQERMPNPLKVYPDPSLRDDAIKTGDMEAMNDIGPILDENGRPVQAPQGTAIQTSLLSVSSSLGFMIQKSMEQGLTVQQETRGWSISDGEQTFASGKLRTIQALDKNLKIDRFSVTEDRAIIKVDVTPSHRDADFNKAFEAANHDGEPVLIDTNGTRYPAVGFIYRDSTQTKIRYMQGSPIAKLADLPAISRSATDKELTILFVVSAGVQINDFKIGEDSMPSDLAKKPVKADRTR